MSAREMKLREERKDTVAMLGVGTVLATFFIGTWVSWPVAMAPLALGTIALFRAFRA